jgi:hypothetical protein
MSRPFKRQRFLRRPTDIIDHIKSFTDSVDAIAIANVFGSFSENLTLESAESVKELGQILNHLSASRYNDSDSSTVVFIKLRARDLNATEMRMFASSLEHFLNLEALHVDTVLLRVD